MLRAEGLRAWGPSRVISLKDKSDKNEKEKCSDYSRAITDRLDGF